MFRKHLRARLLPHSHRKLLSSLTMRNITKIYLYILFYKINLTTTSNLPLPNILITFSMMSNTTNFFQLYINYYKIRRKQIIVFFRYIGKHFITKRKEHSHKIFLLKLQIEIVTFQHPQSILLSQLQFLEFLVEFYKY